MCLMNKYVVILIGSALCSTFANCNCSAKRDDNNGNESELDFIHKEFKIKKKDILCEGKITINCAKISCDDIDNNETLEELREQFKDSITFEINYIKMSNNGSGQVINVHYCFIKSATLDTTSEALQNDINMKKDKNLGYYQVKDRTGGFTIVNYFLKSNICFK